MGYLFSLHSPELQEKLKKIKLVIFDVDGVLTDGKVFWINGQGWTRNFNVKDGFGIHRLIEAGFQVAFLTASNSQDVHERVKNLGVQHYFYGERNKLPGYEKLISKLNIKDEEAFYIGDDLFDLPVLSRVGFSASVPDAVFGVKEKVDYITHIRGGDGATREISDALLALRGE